MSLFDAAFGVVIGIEAGYVNDPRDPGGETKYGISKRAYPSEDVKNLTLDRAKFLYQRDYWTNLGLDKLSWEMALIEFDAAVNQGQSYERTLHGDSIEVMAQRALRYTKGANFETYGHGWFRRLFTIFKAAQKEPT